MLIRTWSLDGITIVDLHGRLDIETGTALRDALGGVLARGRRYVVLNLLGISTIDAAGLGALVDGFTAAHAGGGSLKIVVRSPPIRELLARTNLLGLLSTASTEVEAISSFEPLLAP